MLFRLAIVVSSNTINFINAHYFTWNPHVAMRTDKVERITAHNCGKPKLAFIQA